MDHKQFYQQDFAKAWQEMKVNEFIIAREIKRSHLPIKCRIFNKFIFNAKIVLSPTLIYIQEDQCALELQSIKDCMQNYLLHVLVNTSYFYQIAGFYYTNTHLVLCSIPDPSTLAKSFYNNHDNTMDKLNNLLKLKRHKYHSVNELYYYSMKYMIGD